jgi:peptidoglycan-associated lipoprotein
MPAHTEVASGSALVGDAGSLVPLANGKDISTQSSSSTMNGSPQDHTGTSPFTSQTEFQNALSSLPADIEPIPETFQVAKAEPSDILREQLDKIQEEELATVSAGLEDVFFQFDSWALTAEAKESLERDMGWLNTDPSSLLIIEGHADQRGTQAYNMVLGKKRAMAVRDFLSQLGVDPSRLTVISYGKDKPFCQDITEVCYQLNRRGHLLVQN